MLTKRIHVLHQETTVYQPIEGDALTKIYLAASLKTAEQRARNLELRTTIKRYWKGGEKMGNKVIVYLPQEFLILRPDATRIERHEVFESNKKMMRDSDLVIAIMDDKDTGVTWECGYCNDKTSVVGVYLSIASGVNVMLAESWFATCVGELAFRGWLQNPRPMPYLGGVS